MLINNKFSFKLLELIVTVFFIGKIRLFPGTIASLFSTILFVLSLDLFLYSKYLTVFFFVFIYILGCFCSSVYMNIYNIHDPKEIVIDELFGQLLSLYLIFILLGDRYNIFIIALFGFLFFRLFDISKFSFIGYFDKKVRNAQGVMLDDFAAAIFSVILFVISSDLYIFLKIFVDY